MARMARMAPWRGGLLGLALLGAAVMSSCTTRHRVPAQAAGCAGDCGDSRAACLRSCSERSGPVAALEGVRENLCDKRCTQDYQTCMLACPGVD